MDKTTSLNQRNPVRVAREISNRLKALRLDGDWTQEGSPNGLDSFQRLIRVAVALGESEELRLPRAR